MMKLVVLTCVLAAASASVVGIAPLAYSAPFAYPASYAYPASFAYAAPVGLKPYNYRGPLSLAPGQPANILGADGRPLDTLEVNLDRSAHYVNKALNSGVHLLKKRSAPLIAPVAPVAPIASRIVFAQTPLITPATPIFGRVSPIANVAPYTTYAAPYASYW